MLPDDNSGGELVSIFSALGGRMQNFASLFGDRGTVEVALSIARSQSISDDVIRNLKLVGPHARYSSLHQAQLALDRKVDINSLTGGMLEVQVTASDPDWALTLTKAYLAAVSDRIGNYGRQQIERKRRIVEQRLSDATKRLSDAEAAFGAFKQAHKLADPQIQLGSQMMLRTNLEGQLQAKLVELQTTRQMAAADNPALRAVETQVATLRSQIEQAAKATSGPTGPTVAGLTSISLQYANLYRDYTFAQSIYEVYARSSEEVEVQALVAQSAGEVAIIDAPHLDPKRHFNVPAVALLGLLILLVFFTEVYAPGTGMFDRRRDPAGE
jgi:capsule polysaccharide export protein KpsE/RkpR